LTFDNERSIIISGGGLMSDVKTVFITREVAEDLKLNASYVIKLARKLELNDSEMREAGSRNYLFSEEAVEKLRKAKKGAADQ